MRLYFTSDVHGFFFPTDYLDRREKATGLFRVAQSMRFDGNTLYLDGGDNLQGAPLLSVYNGAHGARMAADMLRACGVQGYTLGNHDFNFGPDVLEAFILAMGVPCICANVIDREGRLPIRPSHLFVLEDGTRVFVAGVVTDWVNIWESAEHLKRFEILPPMEAARRACMDAPPCDFKVLVYHGGIERDLTTGALVSETDENIACAMAEALDYDIILTGHQHMPFVMGTWGRTHIVQAPAQGKGAIVLDVQGRQIQSEMLLPAPIEEACPLAERYRAIGDRVQDALDVPIALLPAAMPAQSHLEMALHGSPLADFINDVQLEATGADVSVTSFANEITGFPKAVTYRDVLLTYRFPNTLTVLRISGADLRAAMERNSRYVVWDDGCYRVHPSYTTPKAEHYQYDFFRGVEALMDYTKPEGQRVQSLRMHGREVQDGDAVTIAMNNYRATGAGGFSMYRDAERVSVGEKEVQQLIIDALRRKYGGTCVCNAL